MCKNQGSRVKEQARNPIRRLIPYFVIPVSHEANLRRDAQSAEAVTALRAIHSLGRGAARIAKTVPPIPLAQKTERYCAGVQAA
jgi:hypothetical protein